MVGAEELGPQVNISVIQIDIIRDNNLLTHGRNYRWLVNFCRIASAFIAKTSISGFDFRWIQQIGGFRIRGVILRIIRIVQGVGKLWMLPVGRHS